LAPLMNMPLEMGYRLDPSQLRSQLEQYFVHLNLQLHQQEQQLEGQRERQQLAWNITDGAVASSDSEQACAVWWRRETVLIVVIVLLVLANVAQLLLLCLPALRRWHSSTRAVGKLTVCSAVVPQAPEDLEKAESFAAQERRLEALGRRLLEHAVCASLWSDAAQLQKLRVWALAKPELTPERVLEAVQRRLSGFEKELRLAAEAREREAMARSDLRQRAAGLLALSASSDAALRLRLEGLEARAERLARERDAAELGLQQASRERDTAEAARDASEATYIAFEKQSLDAISGLQIQLGKVEQEHQAIIDTSRTVLEKGQMGNGAMENLLVAVSSKHEAVWTAGADILRRLDANLSATRASHEQVTARLLARVVELEAELSSFRHGGSAEPLRGAAIHGISSLYYQHSAALRVAANTDDLRLNPGQMQWRSGHRILHSHGHTDAACPFCRHPLSGGWPQ